ncbi:MAG: OmpA family protein [Myxococcota bacterium]|nr:OmpA family protein [Myxococcota bacterium]
MRTIHTAVALGIGGVVALTACSSTQPPKDLTSARDAYDRASRGPAQQHDPADLDAGKKQLDRAEASFEEDGDTQETRDRAYVALRKIELAESVGRSRQSDEKAENVEDAMHAAQGRAVANTSAELGRTKSQLATQSVALQDERSRRMDAEKRAQQAAADLAKFATVKQEARGMVISLSGSVLFASGKSELLPAAQARLTEVATALSREDPLSKIVVEGHTDSQGSAPFNQELSQRRAQSVRDYLVTRGIAGDRVVAQGFGLTRAIADNGSAEGRANNRRVEIVVQAPSPAQ